MKGKLIALIGLMSTAASAAPIVFDGFKGTHAAEVSFDQTGSQLVVTLSNTSNTDMLVPTDVLTSVFFDITGKPTLARVSGVLGDDSTLEHACTPANGVIGGEWAFKDNLVGAPGSANYGISAAGFGLFGPHDLFPGSNLVGPGNVGGDDYGIASRGDNPLTGNTPTVTDPFIQYSAVFTLSGLPGGFNLNNISNVHFQYGTDLSVANTTFTGTQTLTSPGLSAAVIPEPAQASLILGGIMLGLAKRRRPALNA